MIETNVTVVVFGTEDGISVVGYHAAEGALYGDISFADHITGHMSVQYYRAIIPVNHQTIVGRDGQVSMDVIGAIRPGLCDASIADLDEVAEVKGGAVAGAGPLGEGRGEDQEEEGKEEKFFHGGEVFWAKIGKRRYSKCGMRIFFEKSMEMKKVFYICR